MSWQALGVVSRKKWGSQARRLMALMMANAANEDGAGIYASVPTMARNAEVSEATARRALKEFMAEGVIVCVGKRPCSNGHTFIYDMALDVIEQMAELKPAKVTRTPVTVKGVSSRQPQQLRSSEKRNTIKTPITVTPLSEGQPTPVTVTPKPILEPLSCSSEQDSCGDLFGQPPSPSKPKSKRKTYTSEFEAFWKTWPKARRELSDKQTAFRRWTDAQATWPSETLLGAAKHYLSRKEVEKEGYRYCVLAEVFLNGKLDAAVEAFLETGDPNSGLSESLKLKYLETTGNWREEWGPRPTTEEGLTR